MQCQQQHTWKVIKQLNRAPALPALNLHEHLQRLCQLHHHAISVLLASRHCVCSPTVQVIRMVGESQEAVGAGVGGGSSGSNKMPTLEEYGTNLTRQAEEVSS